ncbi:hypothetical protein N665_1029s0008 [Sinapis alba]|nr:hypothetical protein N665_1029s0008 [Sinapis alba]
METSSAMFIGTCLKEHQKIYKEWFNIADSDGDRHVSGNDATKFFSMSKLSRQELKQVWAVADSKRKGFLGLTEFITAMELVTLAQEGHEITSDLLKVDMMSVELPVLEGLENVVYKQKASKAYADDEDNGYVKVIGLLAKLAVVTQPQAATAKASWFKSKAITKPQVNVVTIVDGLKRLYAEKLKPLEVTYRFNDFASPVLTTFIKHLLGCEYPGAHIGPEPTTDRFVVAMSGPDERTIPGNTMAVQADMPFNGLTSFGGAFLSKFECSQMPHPLLDQITLVDTPGVLSGEKQRMRRSYDFTGVISWFASKCDMILLLFDPHKLDISDEFKRVITSLRGNEDKIRVVLNKADQVDTQQPMRVYGALMWSLGKVLNTPEVVHVYIGYAFGYNMNQLFEKEQSDLITDLMTMPKKHIKEFVKRARAAKINAYIMSHSKKEMPAMMGKLKAQQRLIDNLQQEFEKVQQEYHLPAGDFPSVEHFKEVLGGYNIDKFEKLKPKMIQAEDDMLDYDIPDLLKKFRNPYE